VTYNFQSEALEKLLPAGFRKQRNTFFFVQEPNIMVLFQNFETQKPDEFYLAFTHTFFSTVQNKGGKYLLPSLLEQYPLSINITELRDQYRQHVSVRTFTCALHHLTRAHLPEKATNKKSGFSLVAFFKNLFSTKSPSDVINPIEVTLQEGMLLLSEFTPALSLEILSKNKGFNDSFIENQVAEIQQYLSTST
jgi:hypothetical protein